MDISSLSINDLYALIKQAEKQIDLRRKERAFKARKIDISKIVKVYSGTIGLGAHGTFTYNDIGLELPKDARVNVNTVKNIAGRVLKNPDHEVDGSEASVTVGNRLYVVYFNTRTSNNRYNVKSSGNVRTIKFK